MSYISRMKGLFKHLRQAGAITGIITFLTIIIFSCEEDATFVGRNLLPSTDDLNSEYTEDINIETNVTVGDSVVTSVSSTLLLGNYTDQNFGFSKADFMTTFVIADTTIGEEIFVDSMILSFEISDFFGDSLSSQKVSLYELTEPLEQGIVYYSSTLPDGKYNTTPLAQTQISPADSVLSIKIVAPAFFEQFEEVHDSVYADPNDFIDFFEGFYITTTNTNDKGAVFYLDVASAASSLVMYYRESAAGESQTAEMVITETTPRVNTYYHDYTGSVVSDFLNDDTQTDSAIFVSGMAGVESKITFPGIGEWLDKQTVAINKAELFIPVEDTVVSGQFINEFPSILSLLTYQDTLLTYLHDYRMDSDSKPYFGGRYDRSLNAYVFNIGAHFQSYIEGDIEHMDLILRSGRNSISPNRVILKGPEAANRKMKLKITYTEF